MTERLSNADLDRLEALAEEGQEALKYGDEGFDTAGRFECVLCRAQVDNAGRCQCGIDEASAEDIQYFLPALLAEVRAHRAREAADVPTEEMVEAGARAVDPAAWEESQWQVGGRENVLPESEGARAARDEARGLARAVLVAAREARTT